MLKALGSPRGVAGLLLLALAACTASSSPPEVIAPGAAGLPDAVVDALPLRIAFAYDPSVDATITVPAESEYDRSLELRLGVVTRGAFDRVLPALFDAAVPIGSKPTSDVVGTIRIGISDATFVNSGAGITYELTFEDASGATLDTWQVYGGSRSLAPDDLTMAHAVRDAVGTVAAEMDERPAIGVWLATSRGPGR